jgi:hypothetical protein
LSFNFSQDFLEVGFNHGYHKLSFSYILFDGLGEAVNFPFSIL